MYAKNSYARALDLLGRLSNKTELLGRSMEVWEEMLRSDRLSPLGYADIYRELGDSLKYKQEWRAALAAYTKAFEFQPRPVLWVFIAECEMNIDGPAAAVTRLKTINAAGLDVSEYVDYVFTYAVIATTSGNEELLSCVEKLLNRSRAGGGYRPEAGADSSPVRLRCFVPGTGAQGGNTTRNLGPRACSRCSHGGGQANMIGFRSQSGPGIGPSPIGRTIYRLADSSPALYRKPRVVLWLTAVWE